MTNTLDTSLEPVLASYITCALWSSTDDNGDPLDDNYSADDLAESTLEQMRQDVLDFLDLLERDGIAAQTDALMTREQLGHDFWLTRNGHGAGFWDRGLGELGDRLTELAQPYGEHSLYVVDGTVYGI